MHNLFLVDFVYLYMFRAYLYPSSTTVQPYVYNSWYLLLFLDYCFPSWIGTIQPGKLTKYTKNKVCIKFVFLYTIIWRCTVNKT